jgi:DNA-directed RNA polymerase specialized sigma24 family protein
MPECAVPVERDTSIGGPNAAFPATRPSIVAAATAPDDPQRRAARDTLVATYWKPVYKYIRIKWRKGNEDAKDLTQAFLSEFLDAGLGRFDPARGSLRTFVRVSVDGFISHDARAASRLKRGGGLILAPLEDADGDVVEIAADPGVSMEDYFHREWQRQVFALGVEDLRTVARESGKDVALAVFEAHDLVDDPPNYATLAVQFSLTSTTVTNHLAWARRELRRLVLARIDAATASVAEAVSEARALFEPS